MFNITQFSDVISNDVNSVHVHVNNNMQRNNSNNYTTKQLGPTIHHEN